MGKDLESAHHSLSFSEYQGSVTVHEGISKEHQEHHTSLRDLLTILFKHKVKIFLVFVVIVATVTAVTFLIPPTYEAQSTILVKFGREYTYRPEVTDKAPAISVNQEEAINSEIKIMTSGYVIEKVIRTLQVDTVYPDLLRSTSGSTTLLDAAMRRFSKNLKVEVLNKTNVLQVSFQHRDPKIAARAVNLLVDFYKERHFQVYNGPESEFLEKQLVGFEDKLKDSQNNMQNFKQRNMVYSLDEQRGLLLKQRTDLDASLKAVLSHINGMEEKAVALKSRMKELAQREGQYTQTERDKIIVEAKAQLINLRLKERELLNKYPESNRLVGTVRNDIAMMNDFLQQQEQDISSKVKTSNAVYQQTERDSIQTESELKSALAQERTLRQQLVQLDAVISTLDSKEKPLQNLAREITTNDKNYRYYLDRFEEARISNDMTRQKLANLSVIEPARVPAIPIKPNKALNVMVGLVLGAASGLAWALISETTNQGLATPDDAQRRLGIPVLATVGKKG
jgi:uncharacterized protein involved in exopolysaccharide biosynthesis